MHPAIPWSPVQVVAGLRENWRGLIYLTVGAVDLQFGVRDEVGVASGRLSRHLAPPTPSSEERRSDNPLNLIPLDPRG